METFWLIGRTGEIGVEYVGYSGHHDDEVETIKNEGNGKQRSRKWVFEETKTKQKTTMKKLSNCSRIHLLSLIHKTDK